MVKLVSFTQDELVTLRGALQIALEDGSLYGSDGWTDGDDPAMDLRWRAKNRAFAALVEKLSAAIKRPRP